MKEPTFVIIPEYIDSLDISDAEKMLAGRIYALCAKVGYCFASNSFLAKDRKCSVRTVERRVQKLISVGAFTSVIDRQGEKITKRRLFIGKVPTELTRGTDKNDGRGTDRSGGYSIREISRRESNTPHAPLRGEVESPKEKKKREKEEQEKLQKMRALSFLGWWNKQFGTKFRNPDGIYKNLAYWLNIYDPVEICKAAINMKKDKYWKDIVNPIIILRRKTPGRESQDHVATFTNRFPVKEPLSTMVW